MRSLHGSPRGREQTSVYSDGRAHCCYARILRAEVPGARRIIRNQTLRFQRGKSPGNSRTQRASQVTQGHVNVVPWKCNLQAAEAVHRNVKSSLDSANGVRVVQGVVTAERKVAQCCELGKAT